MANGNLPSYLASAKPNPLEARVPWYASTAPAYFGIFMWIAFYDQLGGVLKLGGLDAALGGLFVAAILSHYLFFYVFGLLGMRTGYPLYVVGSSTFGTSGGLLFPGIFMGILQIGWYSVGTYYASKLMLGAFEIDAKSMFDPDPAMQQFSLLFVLVAIAWGYIFATLGAFGINYVAKVSSYLPWISLAMLVIAAVMAFPYIQNFETPKLAGAEISGIAAAGLAIQMVIGFFATAGAAGTDFGTNNRNKDGIKLGGLTGVMLSIIVAGSLAMIIVAGAQGSLAPGEELDFGVAASLPHVSPNLGRIMLLLLAIGSMAPACFCASIIGNSLSTMIPSIGRVPLTLGGATIGIILAATGLAGNLVSFFGIIGASFGPICGAIVADYLLSGCKWAGPRKGISIPGYAAWIIGFVVGISNNPALEQTVTKMFDGPLLAGWHPTAVYSFVVAFVVYIVLASIGLQSKTVQMPEPPLSQAETVGGIIDEKQAV